jgi:ribulose-phosphate 3-epimerase
MVLLMTVNPGFGGQSFIQSVMPKVKALRTMANERGLSELQIQVDGGINRGTIEEAAAAGADVFVSGSGVFKAPSLEEGISELRQLAAKSWGSAQ